MPISIDKLSLNRIWNLHPLIRMAAKNVVTAAACSGVTIRITQTLRTFEEQDKLYEQGRSLPGEIVTHAKGGQSWHNYGLAFDFVLLKPDGKSISWDIDADFDKDGQKDWMEVVKIAKANRFEWGGDFSEGKKDYPHFQKRFGLTKEDARKLLEEKQVDNNGYIIINPGNKE